MLVLHRKIAESVVLNNSVTVYVLGIEGDRVKIGFDAPPDVSIVRAELLDQSTRRVIVPEPPGRRARASAGRRPR